MRGPISVVGKPTLTILVLRFLRKDCSNFLDQLTVVSILIWVRRSPVHTINRRRLYLNPLRNKVVRCLLGLSLPDVRHRMCDNVRSQQTHRVPKQTKQDGNVASVKSTSSPSSRQEARINRSNQSQRHDAQYCTQRCLLGLKTGGTLDDDGPNVTLHRQDQDHPKHPINAEDLVLFLKIQLGKDLDRNCTPFGTCGSYGAPFKLTCTAYGYTVVGKGTTSRLWKEVSREVQVYQILRKTQGSAVPVFLSTIDLEVIDFHDAGDISHMLVMG